MKKLLDWVMFGASGGLAYALFSGGYLWRGLFFLAIALGLLWFIVYREKR